jgi:Aconitase X
MRLTVEEAAILASESGRPRRGASTHQIAVGEFFDAADFVPVIQAHIMADTESLGEAGIHFLEDLAAARRPVGSDTTRTILPVGGRRLRLPPGERPFGSRRSVRRAPSRRRHADRRYRHRSPRLPRRSPPVMDQSQRGAGHVTGPVALTNRDRSVIKLRQ